jgi:Tectonin domain
MKKQILRTFQTILLFLSFSFYLTAQSWDVKIGKATDVGISAGADGTVWIIGAGKVPGGYGIFKWLGTNWTEVSGGATRIAVDNTGSPWIVNSDGVIFRRQNNAWIPLIGRATDIGAGADGSIWIIGAGKVPGGYGIFKWTGSGWNEVGGGAVRIAVDNTGSPWIVNSDGVIFRRQNNAWTPLQGRAKDIGAGADGSIWIIGAGGVPGGFGIFKWLGTDWKEVGGGATNISVGPKGMPWIVNNGGVIFEWKAPPVIASDGLSVVVNVSVKNRIESSNTGIRYSIHIQEPAVDIANFYKGVVILAHGDGGNETDGTLNGQCAELAKAGYIAATMTYRPLNKGWNPDAISFKEDVESIITTITAKYNVSRSKVVVGGLSRGSNQLFNCLLPGQPATPILGIKAVILECAGGDAWKASVFPYPVAFMANEIDNVMGSNSNNFCNSINPAIKSQSECLIIPGAGHCGGTNQYTAFILKMVKSWLP